MSCKDAMLTDIARATPSQTVQDIMDVFETRRFNSVPVVDKDDKVVGMFSMHALFNNLLPNAVKIEGGLDSLGFLAESEPGVAKKLRKLCATPISEVMEKNPPLVGPETTAWESVRLMAQFGSPVMVVDGNQKLLGMITTQSLLKRLQKVLRKVEKEEAKNA
ncbi:MAG: CBS domain-containing protein [Bdellovibrionales bacterium]